MKKTTVLWIAAFVITAASAYYQRVTGPTYALSGSSVFRGTTIPYRLDRSHGGFTDAAVRLHVPDTLVAGVLEWKRFKTEDDWTIVSMRREGEYLVGDLPAQPPAGKLEYFVRLSSPTEEGVVPPEGPVIIRFKGEVPLAVLIFHVLLMFGAMLLSTRTGLEYFNGQPRFRKLTTWTIGLLAGGGLVLGPIVQNYAFGAYWTGWPFGTDLTDNKTVVACLAWLLVLLVSRRPERVKGWAIVAAVITLLVYLIPHSLLGSELDYRAQDTGHKTVMNNMPGGNQGPDSGAAHR